MDIYAKLKEMIGDKLRKNVDIDSITPDTELEDLGLDSLDTAELLINIETEFDLPEITQEEMLGIETVKDVKELIERKRNS